MGLFDLFGSKASAVRRLGQKLTQKYGPPEGRQKAIEQLGAMGTPEALSTLCLRFTVRTDVGIQDDEEKEQVRELLVEAGGAAVGPVREFLSHQESGIAWGLRVLAALVPAEDLLATVLSLLQRLGQEYTRDPEKKLVLLSWLQEHPDLLGRAPSSGPGAVEALVPLLEDSVDDVRIGATRLLARLPASEEGRAALIALLLRDRDNARVRGDVLQGLADLGADVKGHRPDVERLLVEPFFLDREGRVKRRGESPRNV
jgi:hypothetical protein